MKGAATETLCFSQNNPKTRLPVSCFPAGKASYNGSTEKTKCKMCIRDSVNAEENPELRRDILRESIFDWECRHCGYTAQMAYPMIYHDPMNAFMICLRPSGAVSGAEPIPAVRALKKRSVKNPQELKEKILIFEAGLDDAAVELVKNAIVTVVRKNLDGNVHAYFCAATEEELRFALFVKGRQEPVYQTTKMAVYRQSQEVLRTLDYKSPDDFACLLYTSLPSSVLRKSYTRSNDFRFMYSSVVWQFSPMGANITMSSPSMRGSKEQHSSPPGHAVSIISWPYTSFIRSAVMRRM